MNLKTTRIILVFLLSLICINAYANSTEHTTKHNSLDILTWAYKAMLVSHSYNFVNYKSQLKEAETYFTPTAWKEYNKNLTSLNLINEMVQKKSVASMGTASSPILLRASAYKWKVQIPIIINMQSSNKIQQKALQIVTLTIAASNKGHNGLIVEAITFAKKQP